MMAHRADRLTLATWAAELEGLAEVQRRRGRADRLARWKRKSLAAWSASVYRGSC